jgi:hypothetical protein
MAVGRDFEPRLCHAQDIYNWLFLLRKTLVFVSTRYYYFFFFEMMFVFLILWPWWHANERHLAVYIYISKYRVEISYFWQFHYLAITFEPDWYNVKYAYKNKIQILSAQYVACRLSSREDPGSIPASPFLFPSCLMYLMILKLLLKLDRTSSYRLHL